MSRATQIEMLMAGLLYDGEPVSGGKVYTYIAGTSNATSLYTEQDKSTYAANPIVLDSQGRATVYADGVYKFVVKDADDATL